MSFFAPLPEPEPVVSHLDEDLEETWREPAPWESPQRGVVGADIACDGALTSTDNVYLWLDRVVL